MLTPIYATSFKRDVRRAVNRGRDLKKIMGVVELLCARKPLPASLRDHALQGDYIGFRDCHVEPDLLLIYRIVEDRLELICAHLGTHSDLFGA